jgi:hypothetical protein
MLALLGLLLFALPAAAQEDQGRTYVIQKGDTLWGVSERFLKDPDYWPSLWSHNPDIRNPHFVYPGQKIDLYDGRIEILPAAAAEAPAAAPTAPAAEEAPVPAPVPTPQVMVHTLGGARGFVSLEELAGDGILVDTVDNRLLMAEEDMVFVKLNDPAAAVPGTRYSLFETGKEVLHPVTGEPIGYQVTELGSLRITAAGPEVATARIVDAFREIQRGAILRPYRPPVAEIPLVQAARPLDGLLIAAAEGKIALSQYDVVHVDLGADDGLQAGNLLYITRPRTATEYALGGEELRLPEVLLGSAVVLETQPKTAAALVLKATVPIYRGDKVTAATE